MDFFAAQDNARRQTRRLVVLFTLAVIAMIVAVYAVVVVALNLTHTPSELEGVGFFNAWFNPFLLLVVIVANGVIIGLGSLWKMLQLRGGGEAVAEMLGGQRLNPDSSRYEDRVVLNVVEEMALASGIPVPPVYVLENEKSINAFAAGYSPGDAVIGINRGTVEQLNRDELQGVIAHEFSHILSGDMRLNLRMIAVLNGILVLALIGYFCMRIGGVSGGRSRRSGDSKGVPHLLFLGLAIWIIGYIGLFFAQMIKAAISRQREYLADAAAVQFTRNPDGIAGALKMIAARGSRLEHSEAESASHMFFGSSHPGLFDTHPKLDDRIRRVQPSFDGKYSDYLRQRSTVTAEAARSEPAAEKQGGVRIPGPWGMGTRMPGSETGLPINPAVLLAAIGTPSPQDVSYAHQLVESIPPPLLQAAHEPFTARCVVFALLLEEEPQVQSRQLEILSDRNGAPSREETQRLARYVAGADQRTRLPLIEIVQGTLRGMSPPQYDTFRATVVDLVMADQQINLLEFVLYHHLITHLDRHFKPTRPPRVRIRHAAAIRTELDGLLRYLARIGHDQQAEIEAAFQAGMKSLELPLPSGEPAGPVRLEQVRDALRRLVEAAPEVKRQALQACAIVIMHDHHITVEEAELFRALAEAIDCPVPPLAAGDLQPGTAVEALVPGAAKP